MEAVRLTMDDQVAESCSRIERASQLERLAEDYADKDQAVARHVAKLKDVGAATAAERKAFAEARRRWEAERNAALSADKQSREELAAFREQASAEIAALREEAPELEGQTRASLDRLSAARDMLRGHLAELHDFARLSREDLDAVRIQIRQEADRLRDQEESLNRAKAEHRLAVAAFRQQLVEWQGQVAEMKRTLSSSESRLDARQAAVDHAAKQMDETTQLLAEQAEQLRLERDAVSVRRVQMERHLIEMREWYRKKLRELAAGGAESARARRGDDQPALKLHNSASTAGTVEADLNPGDKQLGELLRSHGLVDGETLTALWAEAGRQRRTLRQVLLASGAITLYQLALIEAGNLDALVLDRFRVIDRLRATPREAIYRVFDRPPDGEHGSDGFYLLRHLRRRRLHDAVHPTRVSAAASRPRSRHPNLATVVEVLELNGRPAIVQMAHHRAFRAGWCTRRFPGLLGASRVDGRCARALSPPAGLVHGRISSDSFIPDGLRCVETNRIGRTTVADSRSHDERNETTAASDLRAFRQIAFGWSQLARVVRPPRNISRFRSGSSRSFRAAQEPTLNRRWPTPSRQDKPYESAAERSPI